jgi:hypothetical protein
MKKYLCHWSNQKIDYAESFVADTPHAAYLQFLDENVEHNVPVFVREEGLGRDCAMRRGMKSEVFDEHVQSDTNQETEEESIEETSVPIAISTGTLERKLDELIDEARAIRFLFVVFVFLTVVVPSILYFLLR